MAGVILADLTDSDDEDILEAAYEAMTMAEANRATNTMTGTTSPSTEGWATVEMYRMAKKKKKPNQRMQEWIDARKRHHLSHAQVHMARELGMNPNKLGKLDNHDQEP